MDEEPKVIMGTEDLEALDLANPDEPTDMVSTDRPTGERMEFCVTMRGYALHDMEALIVATAARQMCDQIGTPKLRDEVLARTLELVGQRVNALLEAVVVQAFDEPVMVGGKSIGSVRDVIGLAGREFLTQRVTPEGHPSQGGWGSERHRPRMEYLVGKVVSDRLKGEMEKMTTGAINDVRAEFTKRMNEVIAAEKARFRDALASIVDQKAGGRA